MNFQAVLLQPHKKSSTKRLREVLNSVFRHLDEVAAASLLDVGIWPWNSCRSRVSLSTWEIPLQNATCQTTAKIYISQIWKYKRLCVCVCGGGGCAGHKTWSVPRAHPPKHPHRKLVYALGAWPCLLLQASVEIPGLQLNNQDYFPYVYFHIDLSLLD